MLGNLGGFFLQKPGQRSGTHIADRANFQWYAAIGEQIEQRRVVNGRDAVANAFHSKEFDSFTNLFRAANFAGVYQAVQTVFGGLQIDGAKCRSGYAQFVATYFEGNNTG